ncbi:GTP-binding protein [Methanolobus sp. ZRKC2]|uniref:GTP-binding protein n=1 Tax=Methanolobus sp. ZRKC2 TaxID=3125783 RepID=UPI0032452CFB
MQVSVIGGATGSGKTTVILALCKYLSGKEKRLGIIIQEKGQADYDEEMLKGFGIETREIDSVCIPCSLNMDIRSNLMSLNEEFGPDIVFIETGETVIPHKIKIDIERMELPNIEFLPTVVVVNAEDFEIEEGQLIEYKRKQLESAEIVYINKTDVADKAVVSRIEKLVSDINQQARILRATAKGSEELRNLLF